MSGSQTSTFELHPYAETINHEKDPSVKLPQRLRNIVSHHKRAKTSDLPSAAEEADADRLPSPTTADTSTEEVHRWNYPRKNLYKLGSIFWCFIVLGANDAAYGALIPYLQDYYDLSYTVVSLIFLSPFVGYTIAAFLNDTVHMHFGQRGCALVGPTCKLVPYIIFSVHPPYPVLVVLFILVGFGIGLEDAAWNAWVGAMANANEVLGFLHGFYGVGAVLSPLIATTLITKNHWEWYTFYYFMVGGCLLELGLLAHSFWEGTAAAYRAANPRTTDKTNSRLSEALFSMPAARTTWLCAVFLLTYMGMEVTIGGWIVQFMLRVREGKPFASGMAATGFWLGLTVGRFTLGFVTGRIGERLAIMIYIALAMTCELIFWLVPEFIVSAVFVALQGYFIGPLFPAAIVAASKLLPKHLHVAAIGFAAAFGGSGAAVLPFAVGALANHRGVKVLQPFVLALMAALLVVWLCLPRMNRKRE